MGWGQGRDESCLIHPPTVTVYPPLLPVPLPPPPPSPIQTSNGRWCGRQVWCGVCSGLQAGRQGEGGRWGILLPPPPGVCVCKGVVGKNRQAGRGWQVAGGGGDCQVVVIYLSHLGGAGKMGWGRQFVEMGDKIHVFTTSPPMSCLFLSCSLNWGLVGFGEMGTDIEPRIHHSLDITLFTIRVGITMCGIPGKARQGKAKV